MFSTSGLEESDHFFCTVFWDIYRICIWRGGKDDSSLRDVWQGEPRVYKVNKASVAAAEGDFARIGRLELTPSMLFFGFWMVLST